MASKQRGRFTVLCLCVILLLFGGCAGLQPPKGDLEARLSSLEQQLTMLQASGVGASFRPYTVLTGGGTGALDKTDGATLTFGDAAFVVLNAHASYGSAIFQYVYHDFAASVASNPPYEVKPATNPDDEHAWLLSGGSTAPPVVATGAHTVTLGEVRAGVAIQKTNSVAWTLPTAAAAGYGTMWCVYNVTDTKVITVTPGVGTDKIVLKGVIGGAGASATSDGADGDYGCFVSTTDVGDGSTDGWIQFGFGLTDWQ